MYDAYVVRVVRCCAMRGELAETWRTPGPPRVPIFFLRGTLVCVHRTPYSVQYSVVLSSTQLTRHLFPVVLAIYK
jgi:hypothetical protein